MENQVVSYSFIVISYVVYVNRICYKIRILFDSRSGSENLLEINEYRTYPKLYFV